MLCVNARPCHVNGGLWMRLFRPNSAAAFLSIWIKKESISTNAPHPEQNTVLLVKSLRVAPPNNGLGTFQFVFTTVDYFLCPCPSTTSAHFTCLAVLFVRNADVLTQSVSNRIRAAIRPISRLKRNCLVGGPVILQ